MFWVLLRELMFVILRRVLLCISCYFFGFRVFILSNFLVMFRGCKIIEVVVLFLSVD